MGQDVEISKLTDGGGVLGEGAGSIFLPETCPWTKHTLLGFLSKRQMKEAA